MLGKAVRRRFPRKEGLAFIVGGGLALALLVSALESVGASVLVTFGVGMLFRDAADLAIDRLTEEA